MEGLHTQALSLWINEPKSMTTNKNIRRAVIDGIHCYFEQNPLLNSETRARMVERECYDLAGLEQELHTDIAPDPEPMSLVRPVGPSYYRYRVRV